MLLEIVTPTFDPGQRRTIAGVPIELLAAAPAQFPGEIDQQQRRHQPGRIAVPEQAEQRGGPEQYRERLTIRPPIGSLQQPHSPGSASSCAGRGMSAPWSIE